jgi:hypothetical protein
MNTNGSHLEECIGAAPDEAVKKCLPAETAENAEQRILRILSELCVLRGKTSVFFATLMPGRGHHNAVPLPRSATKNTKDARGAKHNVYFVYFVRFVVMLRCTSGALQPLPGRLLRTRRRR